jgi:protocatechuate 3,4-dioxygenase beta subunit
MSSTSPRRRARTGVTPASLLLDRATLTAAAGVCLWLVSRPGVPSPRTVYGPAPPPLVVQLAAYRPTVVSGTVRDVEGHPVAGISVLAARGDDDAPVASPCRTVTRPDGRFTFVGLPPAPYSFVVLPGLLPAGTSPLLPLQTTLEVDIILDAEPLSA